MRWVWGAAAAAACGLLATPSRGGTPLIRIAFTVTDNSVVDPASARAAAAPLVRRIGKMVGERVEFSYVPEVSSLHRKMKSGEVQYAVASSLVFVELSRKLKLVALAVAQRSGARHFRHTVMVRSNSKINGVTQLKGRSISVNKRYRSSWLYLNTLLHRHGAEAPRTFFGSIRTPVKTQSVVLDLVFGEVDACVAADTTLEGIERLNPRIKDKVRVIARSRPFAMPSMFALKDAPRMKKIKRVIYRLHRDKVGRQVLLIFRLERLAPPRKGDFDTWRELLEEHERQVEADSSPKRNR